MKTYRKYCCWFLGCCNFHDCQMHESKVRWSLFFLALRTLSLCCFYFGCSFENSNRFSNFFDVFRQIDMTHSHRHIWQMFDIRIRRRVHENKIKINKSHTQTNNRTVEWTAYLSIHHFYQFRKVFSCCLAFVYVFVCIDSHLTSLGENREFYWIYCVRDNNFSFVICLIENSKRCQHWNWKTAGWLMSVDWSRKNTECKWSNIAWKCIRFETRSVQLFLKYQWKPISKRNICNRKLTKRDLWRRDRTKTEMLATKMCRNELKHCCYMPADCMLHMRKFSMPSLYRL